METMNNKTEVKNNTDIDSKSIEIKVEEKKKKKKKRLVKEYYEAESWQFSGCAD